jgi:hypothetical protein
MVLTGSLIIRQSKTILGAGLAFNSFPRADSLLKTRRETRTVRFIGICRCVGIRQIDGARSNFYLAVRVSGIPRQKSVDRVLGESRRTLISSMSLRLTFLTLAAIIHFFDGNKGHSDGSGGCFPSLERIRSR